MLLASYRLGARCEEQWFDPTTARTEPMSLSRPGAFSKALASLLLLGASLLQFADRILSGFPGMVH